MTAPAWRAVAAWAVPLVLLLGALAIVGQEVQRPGALLLFWPAWAETGLLALALTPIILTGGIDLSVGSIVALSTVTLGICFADGQWPIAAAAAAAVAVGLAAGAINGALVVAGIPSLVATLATMAFYAGLAMALASGRRFSNLPTGFCQLGEARWAGLPWAVWLFLALALWGYGCVAHTRWGRYLYALGDNRLAATFAALPVRRLEWSLYATSGLVAGIVAVFYTARSGAAIPTAGVGRELEAIACVVLGGTRITGGAGGIGRTVLGVAVMSHLDIALQLAGSLALHWPGSDVVWQPSGEARLVITGALVILVAVWNERMAQPRA